MLFCVPVPYIDDVVMRVTGKVMEGLGMESAKGLFASL